jgi:hypothetical protein
MRELTIDKLLEVAAELDMREDNELQGVLAKIKRRLAETASATDDKGAWVAVSERLPDFRTEVHIWYSTNFEPFTSWLREDGEWMDDFNSEEDATFNKKYVTHWRPLLKPPNDSKRNQKVSELPAPYAKEAT